MKLEGLCGVLMLVSGNGTVPIHADCPGADGRDIMVQDYSLAELGGGSIPSQMAVFDFAFTIVQHQFLDAFNRTEFESHCLQGFWVVHREIGTREADSGR